MTTAPADTSMPCLWDPPHRYEMLARLNALAPDAAARWGSLTPGRMIAHLGDGLRLTLGELEGAPIHGPLRFQPFRWLALNALPMPRGRLKAPPVMLTTPPEDFETDRAALLRLVARCAERDAQATWGESPVFGTLSKQEWGVLSYRHFDHHLRQFGA